MSVDVVIEGIGLWSPAWPDGARGSVSLRGAGSAGIDAPPRPAPGLLASNERRRAPDSVLLALEVAQQACAMAGREPRELPAIFASAYGDLAINDYLCATLAASPRDLSPTKFHNSVHNAPAGYWAIATGCMHSTTAISAGADSFAAGLLEAALLAHCERTAVVYAAYDIGASGPLAGIIPSRALFGAALVLAPRRERGGAALRLDLRAGAASALAPEAAVLQASLCGNPAAWGLPLLAALARQVPAALALPAGGGSTVHMEISAWQD